MAEEPTARVTPAIRLVTFQPVEPGWVIAEREDDRFNIYPVIGWALWEDEEGRRLTPVTNDAILDPDDWPISHPLYYSRQLFRQAQRGDLVLSDDQLQKAVIANG